MFQLLWYSGRHWEAVAAPWHQINLLFVRNLFAFFENCFCNCWEIFFTFVEKYVPALVVQWMPLRSSGRPLTWNKFTSSPPPLGNLSNLTWNSIGECHKWKERDVDDQNLSYQLQRQRHRQRHKPFKRKGCWWGWYI